MERRKKVVERVRVGEMGRLCPVPGEYMGARGEGGPGRLEVGGVLTIVRPPLPFVVISHGWPGCLATIIALRLPVAAGVFPVRWHAYFKLPLSNTSVTPWESLDVLRPTKFDWGGRYIFVVSGPPDFLEVTLKRIGGVQRAIVCCEVVFRAGRRAKTSLWKHGERVMAQHDLRTVWIRDALCGGATDCIHLFGFGKEVLDGGTRVPGVETYVARCLRHYLDGGVQERVSVVNEDDLPPVTTRGRAVRDPQGFYREEGLLPSKCPDCLVACPSYRMRGKRVVRQLTKSEVFRIYQLPLSMDAAMTHGLHPPWPFEAAANPGVYSTIFHQLWGVTEGGGGSKQFWMSRE